MLALRRVPRALSRSVVVCLKANSTLAAAPSVAESVTSQPDASAPATPTTNGRRRRKQPPKRPIISLATPRKWNRPLGEGVVPAYDLALQELKRDSLKLKKEAAELRKVVEAKEAEYQTLNAKLQTSKIPETQETIRQEMYALDAELAAKLAKLDILDVQSDVNLPWVRWQVNNAMGRIALCILTKCS